jgi:DNA replication licensing factor MCM7
VTPAQLRTYIAIARSMTPWVPPELRDYIVAHYVALRQKEKENLEASYITPRTLMSVLRLSQVGGRGRGLGVCFFFGGGGGAVM